MQRPLVLFALGACALFAADAWRARAERAPRLVVEEHGPNARPAATLIREEALFREALELGLERTDPIARGRVIDEMRLLLKERGETVEALRARYRVKEVPRR